MRGSCSSSSSSARAAGSPAARLQRDAETRQTEGARLCVPLRDVCATSARFRQRVHYSFILQQQQQQQKMSPTSQSIEANSNFVSCLFPVVSLQTF